MCLCRFVGHQHGSQWDTRSTVNARSMEAHIYHRVERVGRLGHSCYLFSSKPAVGYVSSVSADYRMTSPNLAAAKSVRDEHILALTWWLKCVRCLTPRLMHSTDYAKV